VRQWSQKVSGWDTWTNLGGPSYDGRRVTEVELK